MHFEFYINFDASYYIWYLVNDGCFQISVLGGPGGRERHRRREGEGRKEGRRVGVNIANPVYLIDVIL